MPVVDFVSVFIYKVNTVIDCIIVQAICNPRLGGGLSGELH